MWWDMVTTKFTLLSSYFFLSSDSPSHFVHNETETIEPCTRTNDIKQFENCTIILGDDEA